MLSLLELIKKLYSIERSFQNQAELFDAIRSVVRCFGLSEDQNAVNETLNVIQRAATSVKEISVLGFVMCIKQAMTTKAPESDKKERDQVSREIGGSIQYIADQVVHLMQQSQ
jgi:hypothetical protein